MLSRADPLTRHAGPTLSISLSTELLTVSWFTHRFGKALLCSLLRRMCCKYCCRRVWCNEFARSTRAKPIRLEPQQQHWNPAFLTALWKMSLLAAVTAWGMNTNAFVPPIQPTRQHQHRGGTSGPAVWSRLPSRDLSARPWMLPGSARTTACRDHSTRKCSGHQNRSLKMQAGGKEGDKPRGSRMLQGPNLELMRYCTGYFNDIYSTSSKLVEIYGVYIAP